MAAPSHIPFVYGVERGIYAEHGIDLTVLEGTGSAVTLQVVASGADDFGFVDGGVYALGAADGVPVASIMTVIQENPADLLFFCDQDIEEPEDLAGKTIGSPAGDAVVSLLPALLSAHDLSMDDVNVVNVAASGRVQAVIEGAVDVGAGYGYASALRYYQAAEQAGDREMCHLRLADYGINTLGHSIVVNKEKLGEDSELMQNFVDATVESIEATEKNRDQAIDTMMSFFHLDDPERDIMTDGLDVLLDSLHTENSEDCGIGWVAPEDAEQTISLLTDYLDLEGSMEPTEYYDNEFVQGC